jgi:hypothetical protein
LRAIAFLWAADQGRVYSLGLRGSCLAWTFKPTAECVRLWWSALSNRAGATAFVSDIRATVYALDAATGALKWTAARGIRLRASPARRCSTRTPVRSHVVD